MNFKSIFLLATIGLSMYSCRRDIPGCTNEDRVGYDPDATRHVEHECGAWLPGCGVPDTLDAQLDPGAYADMVLEDHFESDDVPDYVVRGQFSADAGSNIIIEAGVCIQFLEEASMVLFNCNLSARGTEEQPICFIGERGWKGIDIRGDQSQVQLDHVEFTSKGPMNGSSEAWMLSLDEGQAWIEDCNATNHFGNFLRVDDASLERFDYNSITVTGTALQLPAAQLSRLSAGTLEISSRGVVDVRDWDPGAVTASVRLPKIDGVWRVFKPIIESHFIIPEGTRIQINEGGIIDVRPNARLMAEGTEEEPIVVYAINPNTEGIGSGWGGIYIHSTQMSLLKHCNFSRLTPSGNVPAPIYVEYGASAAVEHCTFAGDHWRGILVDGGSIFPSTAAQLEQSNDFSNLDCGGAYPCVEVY